MLRNSARISGDAVYWKWNAGTFTAVSEFGDPLQHTSYALCIYDQSGPAPALAMNALIPSGGTCGLRPCWNGRLSGFGYRNTHRTPDGVLRVRLQSTARPSTLIIIAGGGADLKVPTAASPTQMFAQNPSLTVQFIKSDARQCWEATYPAPAVKNTSTLFRTVIP